VVSFLRVSVRSVEMGPAGDCGSLGATVARRD